MHMFVLQRSGFFPDLPRDSYLFASFLLRALLAWSCLWVTSLRWNRRWVNFSGLLSVLFAQCNVQFGDEVLRRKSLFLVPFFIHMPMFSHVTGGHVPNVFRYGIRAPIQLALTFSEWSTVVGKNDVRYKISSTDDLPFAPCICTYYVYVVHTCVCGAERVMSSHLYTQFLNIIA